MMAAKAQCFSKTLCVLFMATVVGSFTGPAHAARLVIQDKEGVKTLDLTSASRVSMSVGKDGEVYLNLEGYYAIIQSDPIQIASSDAEDPTAEDPAAEDPAAEDPAAEDPAAEDPAAEDPAAEDPAAEDPAAEDPATDDPAGDDASDLQIDQNGYCDGIDTEKAECGPAILGNSGKAQGLWNLDPLYTAAGETFFYIRAGRTLSLPFTVPDYDDPAAEAALFYAGRLQITSGSGGRDKYIEDIPHLWFSETPNGDPIEGDCEWWSEEGRGNFDWNQTGPLYGERICNLGKEKRVLYLNAETRCHPKFYGTKFDDDQYKADDCTAISKLKSQRTYQFDIARQLVRN